MENKSYTHIFNDILGNVLQLSENPSQFAEYLTQQIRELIGTRTVVIAVKPETEPVKIFSVFPVRRTEWANQRAVVKLAELTSNFETIQYLDNEKSDDKISELLHNLEIDKAIAIPLIAANRVVGSILLLGIMDEFGIESVVDLLNRLSGVFALVIRNSHLYQNMEKLVEVRTNELQKRNDELMEREQQLKSANKEYEQLNHELLKAKEHAEESDRLKSAFLANMSHEIRTPMNGILGFSSLLKEPGLTGDQQQAFIQIIEKSGARMLNTINDIIDISKIEAGQMEVSISEVNINGQIKYLHSFFKPEAEKKGILLSFNCSLTDEESIIKTDREKLYSVLTNLIKNALKYSQAGHIEFGYKIEVETQCIASLLQFYVKDTGIGIPTDRQQAIFDRFVQADIENKQAMQGSGLGLAISKAYVEMLGGKIWVESEPGKGSAFCFTIPCQVEPKVKDVFKNVVTDVNDTHQIKKLNIVIAEDDQSSELLLAIAVKSFSQKIVVTKSGIETVEACRNNPDIDLVLMDIQMPGMNGYEATRQIRQFNKDVIIFAQTAFALAGDREKAIEAGCNDYISKPLKKDELMALIQKYFAG